MRAHRNEILVASEQGQAGGRSCRRRNCCPPLPAKKRTSRLSYPTWATHGGMGVLTPMEAKRKPTAIAISPSIYARQGFNLAATDYAPLINMT